MNHHVSIYANNSYEGSSQPASLPMRNALPDSADIVVKHHSLCGLINIGNTCYMDAVLQILAHIDPFTEYILKKEFTHDIVENIKKKLEKEIESPEYDQKIIMMGTNSMTIQLYKLFTDMLRNNAIAPHQFKMLLSRKNETFAGHAQNDSHDLMTYLLDIIHEETKLTIDVPHDSLPSSFHMMNTMIIKYQYMINSTDDPEKKNRLAAEFNNFLVANRRSAVEYMGVSQWANYVKNNYSVITRHFTGAFNSHIVCRECGSSNYKFDTFTSISLAIPLEKQDITVYDCIDKFIQRETLDGDNMYSCNICNKKCVADKKLSLWNVPNIVIIQLKRFINIKHPSGNIVISKINIPIKYYETLNFCGYMHEYRQCGQYDLIGVIHHYGNYGSGHYVSFSKVNDDWYLFNDASVSKIEKMKFNDSVMTDASYILVYKLHDSS